MNSVKQLFVHTGKLENLSLPCEKVSRFAEMKGRKIYKEIPELRDVCTVMEHPEFFSFYYKYMKKFETFKRMIVLLKLYDMISHKLQEIDTSGTHNAYHKLFILYNLIHNPRFVKLLFRGEYNNSNGLTICEAD